METNSGDLEDRVTRRYLTSLVNQLHQHIMTAMTSTSDESTQ